MKEMKDNGKEIVLEFNLSGFTRKEIDIKLNSDSLEIRAHKRKEKEVKKKGYLHSENRYRAFNFRTTLPKVNSKKANITFVKGKLKIVAPKVSKIR